MLKLFTGTAPPLKRYINADRAVNIHLFEITTDSQFKKTYNQIAVDMKIFEAFAIQTAHFVMNIYYTVRVDK